MLRCSRGGLTLVGNFIINWVVHHATHALAEAIMAFDWFDSTLGEVTEALPAFSEDPEDDLVTAALERADYVVQGIVRI